VKRALLTQVKEAKPSAAAANQGHLKAKTSTADIAAKVENDRLESVRKFAQAHDIFTLTVHDILHNDLQL
jgi:hypothetical protein